MPRRLAHLVQGDVPNFLAVERFWNWEGFFCAGSRCEKDRRTQEREKQIERIMGGGEGGSENEPSSQGFDYGRQSARSSTSSESS